MVVSTAGNIINIICLIIVTLINFIFIVSPAEIALKKNNRVLIFFGILLIICFSLGIGSSFMNKDETCDKMCNNNNYINNDSKWYINLVGYIILILILILVFFTGIEDTFQGKGLSLAITLIGFILVLSTILNWGNIACICNKSEESLKCSIKDCNSLQNCYCVNE